MTKHLSGDKEVNRVARYAAEHGFDVKRARKHIILKKFGKTISMSGSPSCIYGPNNALKDIKKLLTEHGESCE